MLIRKVPERASRQIISGIKAVRERVVGDRRVLAKDVSTAERHATFPWRGVCQLEIVIHPVTHLRISEEVVAGLDLATCNEARDEATLNVSQRREIPHRP